MASVTKRFVLGGSAPAQGDARVLPDHIPRSVAYSHAPAYEKRPVRTGVDRDLVLRLFLRATVDSAVMERSGRARDDGRGNAVAIGGVYVNPGAPGRIEDAGKKTRAMTGMDAELRLP
jgi:hypothetical protein